MSQVTEKPVYACSDGVRAHYACQFVGKMVDLTINSMRKRDAITNTIPGRVVAVSRLMNGSYVSGITIQTERGVLTYSLAVVESIEEKQ